MGGERQQYRHELGDQHHDKDRGGGAEVGKVGLRCPVLGLGCRTQAACSIRMVHRLYLLEPASPIGDERAEEGSVTAVLLDLVLGLLPRSHGLGLVEILAFSVRVLRIEAL